MLVDMPPVELCRVTAVVPIDGGTELLKHL